jgi:hypothetical protein
MHWTDTVIVIKRKKNVRKTKTNLALAAVDRTAKSEEKEAQQ